MARMMAKARWTQRPSWYCCPGHDPDHYKKGSQRQKEERQWRFEAEVELGKEEENMGIVVDFTSQRWRAQEDDLIGGWCVTPEADKRTPAEGAREVANFMDEATAEHVAEIHNAWLENGGK
ncbi:hypothetical protein [Streptomyces sp. NPDC057363]|uniref:hypothetical protein n=1 Tax=Streptomyces sp. NPDC057363 TaxID=3346107 RepID=UPI00363964DD